MKKEISMLITLTCIYNLYAGNPKEKDKKNEQLNISTPILQASKKTNTNEPTSPRIQKLKEQNSPKYINDADKYPKTH